MTNREKPNFALRERSIEAMALRGAKRRGNLNQVEVAQNEGTLQCQEVATPCGLAMTLVPSTHSFRF